MNSRRRSRNIKRTQTRSRRINRTKSRKSKSKCEAKTLEKICGPRKSCVYPNVWTSDELVRKAIDETWVEPEELDYLSKDQMCSIMKLYKPWQTEKFRIISGRGCGMEKSLYNPDVWTVDELQDRARNIGIKITDHGRKKTRDELCYEIADYYDNQYKELRKDNPTEYILPEVDKYFKNRTYRGSPKYVLSLIYYLLSNHDNLTIYFGDPKYDKKYYIGIEYECHDRTYAFDEQDIMEQLKLSKTRFFLIFVQLRKETNHINTVLYDRQDNTATLYEPLGEYDKCPTEKLWDILDKYFSQNGIQFIRPLDICPIIGPQKVSGIQRKQYGLVSESDPGGFCAVFNVLTMDTRLSRPDLSLKEIIDRMIIEIRENVYGGNTYVRAYLYKIMKLRKKLEKKAKKNGISFSKYIYIRCMEIIMNR